MHVLKFGGTSLGNSTQVTNEHNRRFLYETNVGAGLPVVDTLQNMIKSADKLL